MNDNRSSCWHQNIYQDMINGALGKQWPPLERSAHWPVLKQALELSLKTLGNNDNCLLLDLGCGAAALQDQDIVKENSAYIGADLGHIIDNVAKSLYPNGTYFKIDIECEDISDRLKQFDIIVMNAVIDALDKPVELIKKILYAMESGAILLLHRQKITSKDTYIKKNPSYGGSWTYCSNINRDKFNQAVNDCGCSVVKEYECPYPEYKTFIIQKDQND